MAKRDFLRNTPGANATLSDSRGIYNIPTTEPHAIYSKSEVHYVSAGYAATGILQPRDSCTPMPIAPTRPEPTQAAPNNLLANSLAYTRPFETNHYAASPPIAPAPAPLKATNEPGNGTLRSTTHLARDPSGATHVQPCPQATQAYVAVYGAESIRTRDLEPARSSPPPNVSPSPWIAIGAP